MHILATADIHSPKFLSTFRETILKHVDKLQNVDLVLIAGDLMHKGDISGLRKLEETLQEFFANKIVIACPGNEDFEEVLSRVKCLKVKILEDSIETLKIDNKLIKVYCTRGVLDRPTIWQRRHIKNIDEIYMKRLEKIKAALEEICNSDVPILLSHYAITYSLLEGEDRTIWPYLGTCKLDNIIQKYRIIVIHGHAHNSIKRYTVFGKAHILNVSFPRFSAVYLINIPDTDIDGMEVLELRRDGSIVRLNVEKRPSGRSILDFV